MPVPYARVVVNPAAGGYSIRSEWPRIARHLRDRGLLFDFEYTEAKGHAIELARIAVDNGCRYLIAVGGDGTVNEVANGILCSAGSSNTVLGIVSAGTACSFVRSIGIPQDYADACSVLTGEGRLSIDVGVVEYSKEGKSLQRFFVNEANVGFGAAVMEASAGLHKHVSPIIIGPTVNFTLHLLGGIRSLFSYGNKGVLLHVENDIGSTYTCALAVVANGRYLGGGMYAAPRAKLDDGLLDVVTVRDSGTFELLKIWPTLYDGSHVTNPKIKMEQVSGVTIHSRERVPVEADGEILGEVPATFRVVPSALTIVV